MDSEITFKMENENVIKALETIKKADDSNGTVLQFIVDKLNAIENNTVTNKQTIEELVAINRVHEGRISRLEKENQILKETVIDMQSRNMSNNVVFSNIPEEPNEDKDNDKTEKVVRDFLKETLKYDEADTVLIDIAHRMGPPNVKGRMIVVDFVQRSKLNKILRLGKNLEGTGFYMNEQHPAEIRSVRNQLFEERKRVKESKPHAKVTVRNERLIVDGEVVKDMRKDRAKCRDINLDITETAMNLGVKSSHMISVDGSSFQAHMIELTDAAQHKAALCAVYSKYPATARATHNTWAIRMGNGMEIQEDDGEHEGSKHIMRALREKNATDKMIVITRWYGGKDIGKARFETIAKLSNDILE